MPLAVASNLRAIRAIALGVFARGSMNRGSLRPAGSEAKAPSGFIFLVDLDGFYLTDDDGFLLMEPI